MTAIVILKAVEVTHAVPWYTLAYTHRATAGIASSNAGTKCCCAQTEIGNTIIVILSEVHYYRILDIGSVMECHGTNTALFLRKVQSVFFPFKSGKLMVP